MSRPGPLPRRLTATVAAALAACAAATTVAAVATAATGCSGKARTDGTGSAGLAGSAGSSGSGGSAGQAGSAGSAAQASSAGSAAAGSAAAGSAAALKLGDIQIRVEWADVPSIARASPGRTSCNTPRTPSVDPTATWGIPDALVLVEGVRADSAETRIVLADCTLSPRLAVGASLVIESGSERPAAVSLSKRGELAKLESTAAPSGAAPTGTAPRVLRLPIAGHAVSVALDAGAIYQLATTDKAPETAWIAAPAAGAAAVITDAAGQVVLRGVSVGPHAVTAWLPLRAGQPARLARGTVTVAPGELAELTLQLAPVP